MKIIKKLMLITIILITLTLASCTKENTYEEYNFVILRINKPFNLDDLDNIFEIPLQEKLEQDYIGEITGDGYPLDEEGIPYATDIEFEIRETKMVEFINLIRTYKLPICSTIKYNNKLIDLNGTLEGLELKIKTNKKEKTNEIYEKIKTTFINDYTYTSNYNYNEEKIERIYLYTENIEELLPKIENFIKINFLENNITINKMHNNCEK